MFCCGYIKREEVGNTTITLYKEGACNVWQIKAFDFDLMNRVFWLTATNMGDAIKIYKQQLKQLKKCI